MKQFKLTAQHYDMAPGTIVFKMDLAKDLYTVNPDAPMEPNLRIVPADKVEEVK